MQAVRTNTKTYPHAVHHKQYTSAREDHNVQRDLKIDRREERKVARALHERNREEDDEEDVDGRYEGDGQLKYMPTVLVVHVPQVRSDVEPRHDVFPDLQVEERHPGRQCAARVRERGESFQSAHAVLIFEVEHDGDIRQVG